MTNTTDRGDVTIATYFDYTETVIELRTQDADWIGALHQRVADGKACAPLLFLLLLLLFLVSLL